MLPRIKYRRSMTCKRSAVCSLLIQSTFLAWPRSCQIYVLPNCLSRNSYNQWITHCSIATQLSARLRYSLRVKTATEISGWPYYFCSVLLTARTTGRLSTIWRLRATVFLRLQRSPLETVGCLWTAKRLRSAHVFPVEFFFPSRSILHADRDRERTPVEQTAEQAQSRRGFFQDLGSDSVIACFY